MYSGTPNQSLTSRGIQLSFLTTAELQNYEKIFMDQGAAANGYKLPAAKIHDLFRMSNIDNETLVVIWDLSSIANLPFLTLPEFVLAMFLINLRLNGKPIPHSLPANIRQEIQMAINTLNSQPMQNNSQFTPQQQLPMMTGMPPPQLPLMTGVPVVQTSYTTGYQVPMQTGYNAPPPPPQPQLQNFDFAMKMMPNQSRASNLLGTAAGANRNSWKISPEDKQRYREVFQAWDAAGTGYMSGEIAKEVFTQSQLPPNDLQKIWNLADADNKGSLDIDEFGVAMHLIYRRANGLNIPNELPTELSPPTNVLKKFVLGHRPPASAPRFNSTSEPSSRQKIQPSRRYVEDSDSDSDVDMETVDNLHRQISEAKRNLGHLQSDAPINYGGIDSKYSLEELKEKIKRANQDLTTAYRNNAASSKYLENTSTLFELLESQKSLQDEIQYLCNRDIPVLTRQLRGSAAELRDAKVRNSKKNDSSLDFMSFINPTGPGGSVTESDRVRAKAQAMMAARRAASGSGPDSGARRAEEEKEEADRKADIADHDTERSRTALSEMNGDLRYLEQMGRSNHFDDKKRFDNVHELSYELRRFIDQLNHDSATNYSHSSQNYGSRGFSSTTPSASASTAATSSASYKSPSSSSTSAPVSSPNPASSPARPRTADEIKKEAERRVQERLATLQAKRNPGGVSKAPAPSNVSKPDEAAAQKVRDDERQAQEKLRMSVAQRQEERERRNPTLQSTPVYNTVEQSNIHEEEEETKEDETERLRREQEEYEQRRAEEEKELEERRKQVLAKEEAARQARFDALKREEEEAELRAQKFSQHKPEEPVVEQKEAPTVSTSEVPSAGAAAPPPPPPPPPPPAPATVSAPAPPSESTSTPTPSSKNPFAKLQQANPAAESSRSIPGSSQPEKPNEASNKRTSYNPFAAFSAFSATKGASKDDSDSEDDGWGGNDDSDDENEFPAAGSAKNLAGMIFNVMNKKQGGPSLESVPEGSPKISSSDVSEPSGVPPPPPPPAPAAPAAPQQAFTPPASGGDSRGALLSQIQLGKSLKKVATNDRSSSSVAGKVLGGDSSVSQPITATPSVVSHQPQPEPVSTPTPSDGFFSELQARTNTSSTEHQTQPLEESGPQIEYIALWDYVGAGPDDLSFSQDDVVLVGDENDEDWWFGTLEKSKQSGYFPRAYVESKPDALNLKARTLYDFDAPEGQDCISFTMGSTVTIIRKDNNDWWTAQAEDGSKTGLVPANYVELI